MSASEVAKEDKEKEGAQSGVVRTMNKEALPEELSLAGEHSPTPGVRTEGPPSACQWDCRITTQQ